jgi:hypothetical protein
MNREFPRATRAARESILGRTMMKSLELIAAAWGTSVVRAWSLGSHDRFVSTTAPARLRWTATTIATAAVAHLALRQLLSSTVAPALPMIFIAGIAAGAAIVAWQAEAFERAWRER